MTSEDNSELNFKLSARPDDRSFFGRGVPKIVRVSSPVLKMAHKFSAVADKMYMTSDHCFLYIARRVGDARLGRERAQTVLGRIQNKISGVDCERVSLSGAVLAGALEFVNDPVPETLDRGQDYKVRFELADRLLAQMQQKMEREGRLT